ncbi:hypothetical protein [Kitasatospora cineracea]|uniref:hypothetical protein n=1 Tax=Kitasatospora cineracea TaxID=88074 RepID=UPI00367C29DF
MRPDGVEVRVAGVEEAGEPVEGVRIAVGGDPPGGEGPVEQFGLEEAGRRAHPGDGHDGAGLGLPPARRLARSAGGDITLASSSKGARFVVSLPAG